MSRYLDYIYICNVRSRYVGCDKRYALLHVDRTSRVLSCKSPVSKCLEVGQLSTLVGLPMSLEWDSSAVTGPAHTERCKWLSDLSNKEQINQVIE